MVLALLEPPTRTAGLRRLHRVQDPPEARQACEEQEVAAQGEELRERDPDGHDRADNTPRHQGAALHLRHRGRQDRVCEAVDSEDEGVEGDAALLQDALGQIGRRVGALPGCRT